MAGMAIGLSLALLAGISVHAAIAPQSAPVAAPLAIVSTVQPELAVAAVMKEIDDPTSGMRWFLVEDPAHPGGPGRLIAVSAGSLRQSPAGHTGAAGPEPVIRAGDRVQVEEHSAVVDGSLQAIALGSAVPGAKLRVELRVGGRVVTARALGPGRAELAPAGARP